MNILSVRNVVKRYHNHTAVNDLSFDMRSGIIFGLLGPNGAGKTSLIRIITSITKADEGEVLLDGRPIDDTTPMDIGYMPEERGLYKKMKVYDHLMYLAQLRGMSYSTARKEIKHWFEKFDIMSWKDKKIQELSKGMQQKIQFIATVIHRPKLLILDEPFSGLDPVNANRIKDEIHELNSSGISIIFSTHRMEQVEEICKEIILIHHGQKILEGNVADVKEQFKKHQYRVSHHHEYLPKGVEDNLGIIHQEPYSLVIQASANASGNEILRTLIEKGVEIRSFEEVLPSVNEIFIQQVGQQ